MHRERQWQHPCACRRWRIRPGSGGSHPSYIKVSWKYKKCQQGVAAVHLVVEDLRLARDGVRNKRVLEDVENILAHLLELKLNIGTVLADGFDVLVRALLLLLLLNRGDDSP